MNKVKNNWVTRFLDRTNSWLGFLSGAMLVAIVLITCREVGGRYAFNAPFLIAQDISVQLLLAATFWGAGYVVAIKGFPTVDLFYRKFPRIAQDLIDFIGGLGGLAFLVVLFWQVMELTIVAYVLETRTTSPALVRLAIPYTNMALGLLFFILAVCRETLGRAISLGRNLKRRDS